MLVRLRDASINDLPKIFEIERMAFDHPWSLNSFKRELSLPFSRVIVAVTEAEISNGNGTGGGDSPAGFLCRWLLGYECHILDVAVHPDFRRMGVGACLMNSVIDEAKAKNGLIVTLEVRRSNVAARNLYRKLNFEERRLRKNYYAVGEDAIVMELQLR